LAIVTERAGSRNPRRPEGPRLRRSRGSRHV
jgi:hypothetical protein